MQVSIWLSNIVFHMQLFWLHFGCNPFRIMPDIVSRLLLALLQPSEVAVLFNWNLRRLPFFRQVVNLDLLLCTEFVSEHEDLLLSQYFTQLS